MPDDRPHWSITGHRSRLALSVPENASDSVVTTLIEHACSLCILFAAVLAHEEQLRCVNAQDQIVISIPIDTDKRIGSMAVVYHRKWLTLVDEGHRFAAFGPGVRRLVLVPARQIGVYWGDDGKERRVKVFARGGVYRIVFTDNLETEPENMVVVDCLVRVR